MRKKHIKESMPNKKPRKITFAEAINEALGQALRKDKNLICYGLGVTDPKEVFSTTSNLKKKFGGNRVFDVPCSENALTGISIGAAINGVRSVLGKFYDHTKGQRKITGRSKEFKG